jgi:[acyl-carrier-protein] S-malonyltransferase
MGQDFVAHSSRAREIFAVFDRIVQVPDEPTLSQVCFEGPETTLKNTRFTQPGILAASIAAYEVFRENCDVAASVMAGHSLGEYAALFASGVITLETAARLIDKRATLMSEAPDGTMAAVLGLPQEAVEAVVKQVQTELPSEVVTVANYNSAEQLVLSGTQAGVERAGQLLKEAGAKRFLPLPVSGAFHSPLMREAGEAFRTYAADFEFAAPFVPVITNVDAQASQNGAAIRDKLAEQIYSPVRWTQTMMTMVEAHHVQTIIEFGPGKVLTGLAKRLPGELLLLNVYDSASLHAALEALNARHAVAH